MTILLKRQDVTALTATEEAFVNKVGYSPSIQYGLIFFITRQYSYKTDAMVIF